MVCGHFEKTKIKTNKQKGLFQGGCDMIAFEESSLQIAGHIVLLWKQTECSDQQQAYNAQKYTSNKKKQ